MEVRRKWAHLHDKTSTAAAAAAVVQSPHPTATLLIFITVQRTVYRVQSVVADCIALLYDDVNTAT